MWIVGEDGRARGEARVSKAARGHMPPGLASTETLLGFRLNNTYYKENKFPIQVHSK
jgi:hypothetical protein